MSALITARDVSGRKRIMITQGRGLVIPVPYLPPSPKAHHFRGDSSPRLEPLLSAGGSGLISTHLSSGPTLRRDPISPSWTSLSQTVPSRPPWTARRTSSRGLWWENKALPLHHHSPSHVCHLFSLGNDFQSMAALECGGPQTKRQEMIGWRGGKRLFFFPHWPPPPMPIPHKLWHRPARGYDCRPTNLNMNLHIKGNLLIPKEASPNTKVW